MPSGRIGLRATRTLSWEPWLIQSSPPTGLRISTSERFGAPGPKTRGWGLTCRVPPQTTDVLKWPFQAHQAKGAKFTSNLVVFAPNRPCFWPKYSKISALVWETRGAALDAFEIAVLQLGGRKRLFWFL